MENPSRDEFFKSGIKWLGSRDQIELHALSCLEPTLYYTVGFIIDLFTRFLGHRREDG